MKQLATLLTIIFCLTFISGCGELKKDGSRDETSSHTESSETVTTPTPTQAETTASTTAKIDSTTNTHDKTTTQQETGKTDAVTTTTTKVTTKSSTTATKLSATTTPHTTKTTSTTTTQTTTTTGTTTTTTSATTTVDAPYNTTTSSTTAASTTKKDHGTPHIRGTFHTDMAKEVLVLVNQAREEAGLGKLTMDNGNMMTAAKIRSFEITVDWAHERPDHDKWDTVFKEENVTGYRAFGENLAKGQTSVNEVFNDWMNSPGHRANIMQPLFTHVSIVAFEYDGHFYWVQLFGAKK